MPRAKTKATPYARLLASAVLLAAALPMFGATIADPPRPTTQPRTPGSPMDRAVDGGSSVYVDDSFASVEKIRKADRFQEKEDQWQRAVTTYQEIIDEYGQKLVYLDDGSYISITDYVRERLLAMPAVQRGDYDQFFGLDAEKRVNAAIDARDLTALVRVCDKYFPAKAAVKGLSHAAEWYFERGEFAAAARTWQQLLTHPLAADKPVYLHRAILAEHLNGRDAQARKLHEQLLRNYPDEQGTFAGETVTLAQHAGEFLKTPVWETPALAQDEWPTFQGSNQRNAVPDVTSQAGAKLWAVALAEPDKNKGRRPQTPVRRLPSGQIDNAPRLNSHPVISDGQLFVHNGNQVMALSATAGAALWSYPQQVDRNPNANRNPEMGYYNPYASIPAHDSCTVYGEQVFALLPAAPQNSGAPVRGGYYYTPNVANRLVALDKGTGKELWSIPAASLKVSENLNGTLMFVGSPLVTRQGVFTLARKIGGDTFSQMYLIRLNRNSGEVDWTAYLCSIASAGYYGYRGGGGGDIPMAALADDTVYISTGQGADCAVDANVGRILWLQVTEAAKKPPAQPYYAAPPAEPSWKVNPPLIYKDKLVTLESDSFLRVYDRWSGRLVQNGKIDPKKDLGKAEIIPGIIDGKLVTMGTAKGSEIRVLDLEKGLKNVIDPVELPTGTQYGKLMGRPFLTRSTLYIPMDKGIAMVNLTSGELAFNNWPKDEADTPGKPGNLLVTSEQVIVINDQEISGYSRWETARDNRLAEIAKDPNNPKPYLALAEVAFRTLHLDVAQENMAKAVQLATAPNYSEDALVTRLYRTNLNFAEQLLDRGGDTRDRARFYFEQCQATARNPQANAEWRLGLTALSLQQKNLDEAAALYNAVLNDRAMRNAPYEKGENMTRAGITAEAAFKALIAQAGREAAAIPEPRTPAELAAVDKAGRQKIYAPYETRAAEALARAADDTAALQQVVDAFPNSLTAINAGRQLAAAHAAAKAWEDQARALRWVYTRIADPRDKALTAAHLAQASAEMKRWNSAVNWADRGRRHAGDLTWNHDGKTFTFATLKDAIRNAVPNLAEMRLARLPEESVRNAGDDNDTAKPGDGQAVSLGEGTLMVPLEGEPNLRRADTVMVLNGADITAYAADTLAKKWTATLPNDQRRAVLMGTSAGTAVIATPTHMLGLDMADGSTRFALKLEAENGPQWVPQNQINVINGMAIQQGGIGQINQSLMLSGDGDWAYTPNMYQQTSVPSEQARAVHIAQTLGNRSFGASRIIGDKLLLVQNNRLSAVSLASGKRLWLNPVTLPEGTPSVIHGNDEFVLVQVDQPGRPGSTLVILNADKGTTHSQVAFDDQQIQWRGLSEDGTLFLVAGNTVSAYDLHGDMSRPKPLWKREDIKVRHPNSTLLTLDGLVVARSNDLVCLAQDSGEQRWKSDPEFTISTGNLSFLRSVLDGDNVVVSSPSAIYALRTVDGKIAWASFHKDTSDRPAMISALITDPYFVVLASGPVRTTQRQVQMHFLKRVNTETGELNSGKLDCTLDLAVSDDKNDREGPNLQFWQAVDNAIIWQSGNNANAPPPRA